jgi:hypothetical protein
MGRVNSMSDHASRRAAGRAIVVDMSRAPAAKKLDLDPIEAAFDNAAVWDHCPEAVKEEIAARMSEVREAEANGTLALIPGAVVSAEIAERAERAKRGE